MLVRLRYLAHDLEVPLGQFVIGRSADCQLSLDDPLVSRRHALLTVRHEGMTVEDLGSRNGVLVNGTKIEGQHKLADGDLLTVGSQEMAVECSSTRAPLPTFVAEEPASIPPTASMRAEDLQDDEEESMTRIRHAGPVSAPVQHPDKRVNALSLIGGVADKALALGRVEDAQRILQRSLYDVLEKARRGEEVDANLAERAVHYATRLASATGEGAWLDFVFELYTIRAALLPAAVVDELYTVVRKVRAIDQQILRSYAARMALETERFRPAERFLQQRIEGLERLGALK